ncbi:MAG TPA: hypothetical protein ENN84_07065 [Candidatus Marinimicrobia bacterium]|nr:hypothetical protein [Candidatus Neomarinimicrobiota bacterium]
MKKISRRDFIRSGTLVSAGLIMGCRMSPRFDLIIHNGLTADACDKPLYKADLAISGEKIAAIGDLSRASAKMFIDAAGKIVSPGFIDIHPTLI